MKKIFISHSSQNAWIIPGLLELIAKVNPDTYVFCSSDAVIDPGVDYKDEIYVNLEEADVFVAIISREFWESKYCIFEIGAAYQRYCSDERAVSIQPLLLPPLDKGIAFANTPMVQVQLADLTDAQTLSLFFQKIAEPDGAARVEQYGLRISEFAAFVKRGVFAQTTLLAGANVNAYYDERPNAELPREHVVRCKNTGENAFRLEFHLAELAYTPTFASMAFECDDHINMREYLTYDRNAELRFTVNNLGNALKSITTELKEGRDNHVYRALEHELGEGENPICIQLGAMDHKPLEDISQICFVLHPRAMNVLDGEIEVSDMEVAFGDESLLGENEDV